MIQISQITGMEGRFYGYYCNITIYIFMVNLLKNRMIPFTNAG